MNTERIADRTQCSVYILELSGKLPSKRQSVALSLLRSIHPTSLDGKEIAIRKNPHSKNEYICIVYPDYFEKPIFTTFLAVEAAKKDFSGTILFKTNDFTEKLDFKNGSLKSSSLTNDTATQGTDSSVIITPESKIFITKKLFNIIFIILLLISALFISIYLHSLSAMHAENARIQNEILEQKKQQAQIVSEKKKFLESLEKKYNDLYKNRKTSPYNVIELIHKSIDKKASVKTLSITGNDFVLEAEGKDSTVVLSAFEQDGNIQNAGIQHIIREAGKDLFTLTGTVTLPFEEPEPTLSMEEKIKFYLDKNEAMMLSENLTASQSEYINDTRNLLRKCSLEPTAIQNMNAENGVQSEYTVYGNILSLMDFLYQANEKNISFSTIRIQQQEKETLSTFRIKLPPSEESKISPSELQEFSPNEVARTFRKTQQKSAVQRQHKAVIPQQKTQAERDIKAASFLSFIGQVKNGTQITAYIKNKRTGEILKVPFTEEGKLFVTIDSETYEVKQ